VAALIRFFKSDRLSFVLRLVIGAMSLLAAIPKLMDIEKNSVYLIYSYDVFPIHPINVARFLGTVVPYLELLIGIGLLLGVFTRLSAAGWAILSLGYFLTKLDIIFIQGQNIPCGCFAGILPNLLVTQSIWIDVVAIVMCVQIVFSEGNNRFASSWALLPERWKHSCLRNIW
jgi:hypothetical protein